MSDDAWKIIGLFGALLVGIGLGSGIDGAIWRADCEAIGAHQSGSQVYECKLRPK